MGFWNALSVLAPVAPALSDAQDIRADRAKEAQDLELKQAQTVTQQMAAEGAQRQNALAARDEQDRQIVRQQLGVPLRKGTGDDGADYTDYWTPQGVKRVADTPSGEARFKSYIDSLEKAGIKLTPEQKEAVAPEFYGVKAPPAAKFTPLPGAAGQPQTGPDGKSYVIYGKDESGNIVSKPIDANFKPPTKTLSPNAQYANLLTKQILANRKQGPPLSNEEAAQLPALQQTLDGPGIARMKAMAEYNAANRLFMATDPNTNMETAVPISAGVAAFNRGAPFLAGAVSAPTGMDKKNSMLAQSALQQVNRMQAILKADPNLVGPGSGQLTKLQMWLGTQDPDAQQFLISSLLGSEHGVAVFGGRNIHTIQDLNNALGSMKTNPAALSGALDVIKETMAPWATAGGRLPEPRTAGGGTGGGNAANKQHSLRTAMALPFNKDKSAAQVKSDLESHGYTVVP